MKLLCCAILASFVFTAVASAAEEFVGGVSVDPKGAMSVGGISMDVIHFSQGWAMSELRHDLKADAGFPKRSGGQWELRGKFATKSGGEPFTWVQTLKQIDASSFSYEASVHSDAGLETNTLALSMQLPVDGFAGHEILIDGKPLKLPAQFAEQSVLSKGGVRKLQVDTALGQLTIEGTFALYIQDDRKFNGTTFGARISFTQSQGVVKDSNLSLTIRHAPYASTPIDIAPAANMGWADEVDGDKKGGWTDQGSENDLHMLKVGTRAFGPLNFTIIDPAKNDGKACIVLAGPQREYFPKSAKIPAGDKKLGFLYLLHATAWTPSGKEIVGNIRVEYADGSKGNLDVMSVRDVGNWWAPAPLPNGAVVWTAENKSAFVGLYLSRFALEDKPVKSIELESTGKAVWMIAGMTAAEQSVPLPTDAPFYIVAGNEWKPLEHSLDVEAGSILDFSGFLDAPAGKYGNIVVKGSHFEFANRPGQRVRFYGANICFTANYQDKAKCEELAARLARLGYNSMRLHHYDRDLTDQNAADSVTLEPKQLDKFEYLIHCLKQKGIYINIDLYTIRQTKANEIPEIGKPVQAGYKAAVPLLDSGMKNWQAFAKNVLTHKNPYTGMTLAEDPVLVGICPLNEDPLGTTFGSDPDVRKLYDQRFEKWLAEKKLSPKDPAERNSALSRFLTEIQVNATKRMYDYLKGLGVKAPLTGANCVDAVGLTPVRAGFEYVDNHAYWDHPGFPERQWSMPFSYGNKCAVSAAASVPRGMIPTRIVGKPFVCTEINYCFPNRYRAEGGPLLGAYAALQDWDGIWRFAYSHDGPAMWRAAPGGGFDLAHEPLSLMSERIAMLLFLRGDVAASKGMVPYMASDTTIHGGIAGWGASGYGEPFMLLGLCTGVGSVYLEGGAMPGKCPVVSGSPKLDPALVKDSSFIPADDKLVEKLEAAKAIPAGAVDLANRRITSDTGQIELLADKGTFKVVSDRSEVFVMKDAGEMQGKSAIVSVDGGMSVVSISAMDGKPIAQSGRLLVMHLTDVQNTKIKYRGRAMTLLEQWGELPHLVRASKAQVKLKLEGDRGVKAYAIDMAGKRKGDVEVKREGGSAAFTADTARGCLAYEVVRE